MVLTLRRGPRDEVARRHRFIVTYEFPPALADRVKENYDPELDAAQLAVVLDGLRAWFLACVDAGKKTLGMPSEAVDTAWHEFILMTHDYHAFCEKAFGHYLHHSPEATMKEPVGNALARTVKVLDGNQAATAAAGIPFLFALDSMLELEGGNHWSLEELDLLRADVPLVGDPATGLFLPPGAGADGAASCGASCGGGSCGGGWG